MAEITEKIDLTLNSYFAGDSNKWLRPQRWRNTDRPTEWFFLDDSLESLVKRFVSGHFPGINNWRFFRQPPFRSSTLYFRLFKVWPRIDYEEMLGYGDPDYCQMCGVSLNLFTRNAANDSCERCYQNHSMKGIIL